MSNALQKNIFAAIRALLPVSISLADELADVLNISVDSAYRRIRNEKSLLIEELEIVCKKFNLSLDSFMQSETNNIVFTDDRLNEKEDFTLTKYLQYILDQLQQVAVDADSLLFYFAKDVPVFHYFQFIDLAAFKFYAWTNTVLTNGKPGKFNLEEAMSEKEIQLCKKIIDMYSKINSEEIWSLETINSTIRQIEYCKEAMLFENAAAPELLYDKLLELVDHIEEQCGTGKKSIWQENENKPARGKLKLYYNGSILGDNTILMQMTGIKKVYLNHGILNYVPTVNETFCDHTYHSIKNIINHSSLISESGSKERSRFFNALRKELLQYKQSSKI